MYCGRSHWFKPALQNFRKCRHSSGISQIVALAEKCLQLNIAATTSLEKLKTRSQDYFWYSPVLRSVLKERIADIVCAPKTEEEVATVLRECFKLGIPITPRGAGTGNYGQAVPLRGGAILDLRNLTGYQMVSDGVVQAQAGQLMGQMEAGLRQAHGYELRFFPSTVAQATIGGFISGGSCGVGSINYGVLRDPGNVSAVRVVTMEAEPRVLDLTGNDCLAVVHAYGTNGIITHVEMPLAPAQSWVEVAATFPNLASAGAAALAIGESPAVSKRNLCTLGAPIPSLPGFEGLVRQIATAGGDSTTVIGAGALNLMSICVASTSIVSQICEQHGGSVQCVYVGGKKENGKRYRPLYEWAWNHTTLRALRKDENITYLQCGYSDPLNLMLELQQRYGGLQNENEYMTHLEWVRLGGRIGAFGLPLIKWRNKEQLDKLIAEHNAAGAPIFNPHTFVLEDGGMKQTDAVQLAFKQNNDPEGLLNPGKMRAWEEGRPVVEGVLNAYDQLREGVAAPELTAEPLTPDMIAELDRSEDSSSVDLVGVVDAIPVGEDPPRNELPAAAEIVSTSKVRSVVTTQVLPSSRAVHPPFARYAHASAVRANSDLLFVSGQLGIKPDGAIPTDAGEQAAICFGNIAAILDESGLGMEHVVKFNAYVSDRDHLQAYMRARDVAVGHLPPVTSTLMIVKGFSRPEFLVEVEAIAACDGCLSDSSNGFVSAALPSAATSGYSQGKNKHSRLWYEWSTADFAEADLSNAVAILPIGATEAHGPHLPLGVDSMHNQDLLALALEKMPDTCNVLALPPLHIGVSCEHSGFAGTLEVSAETAAAMWNEIGACVARAGVRKLVLYNSHGGNHALAEVVARQLRLKHGMMVVLAMNLAQGMTAGGSVASLFPEDEVRYGIHGGALETSLMLHLRPNLVCMDAAKDFASAAAKQPKTAQLQRHSLGFSAKTGWLAQDLNAAGVVGAAASLSDSTKGAALAEASASAFAQLLQEVHAIDVDDWLGTEPLYPPQGSTRLI